jgi:two-component system NtrC family response regulator
VLITGETGTGKELFARALHENSARADRNFVVVDCAALTESLVESTLFGHVKGSFTGAISNHEGLIAAAHGGTLFLDEVGELSLDTQKKFLRVMEEKRFRPVGAKKEIESDFRLVAATNRDLEAMVQRNEFRNDLLYRIRSQEIHLPPLRERVEDVPEMVYYYINRICERMDLDIKKFHPEFLEILTDYHWPGNVRELVNTLEQALSGAVDESYLHQRHLPLHMRISYLRNSLDISSNSEPVLSDSASPLSSDPVPDWKSYREYINQQAEDRYFRDLYLHTGGKVKEMAELSGLTESRIYGILKKHNISKKSE